MLTAQRLAALGQRAARCAGSCCTAAAAAFIFAGASRLARRSAPEADGLFQSVAPDHALAEAAEFPLAEPYRIKLMQAAAETPARATMPRTSRSRNTMRKSWS